MIGTYLKSYKMCLPKMMVFVMHILLFKKLIGIVIVFRSNNVFL